MNKTKILKSELHARNRFREGYDFKQLISSSLDLGKFVKVNEYGNDTIDFFNPLAVKCLNKALLKHYYQIDFWEFPKDYLTPPIPGRADYLHYLADLIANPKKNEIPSGNKIKCLDIGVGANCIYPIIGVGEYNWSFIGSDIDPIACDSANKIIKSNPTLADKVEIRFQKDSNSFFNNIISENEKFEFTICNPPFHSSSEEAQKVAIKKISNLKNKKIKKPILNFSGNNNELWCDGGEEVFISKMIKESRKFSNSCLWFTSLVAKESSMNEIYYILDETGVAGFKAIPMSQGNKKSRIIIWTFLSKKERENWKKSLWD
jgi:23S rRNA (adenine1618-N6)-methyltransferase